MPYLPDVAGNLWTYLVEGESYPFKCKSREIGHLNAPRVGFNEGRIGCPFRYAS